MSRTAAREGTAARRRGAPTVAEDPLRRRRGRATPTWAVDALTCETCGDPFVGHGMCAACGILGGPGHESLSREPHGPFEVCAGCWLHLSRSGLRVGRPWAGGTGGLVVAVPFQRRKGRNGVKARCTRRPDGRRSFEK